jgi:hypothetical protein
VTLHRADAAPPGALFGRITALEYLGAVCRVALDAGGLSLLAAVAPADVAVLEAAPGAEVAAMLPPERLMVFAEDV